MFEPWARARALSCIFFLSFSRWALRKGPATMRTWKNIKSNVALRGESCLLCWKQFSTTCLLITCSFPLFLVVFTGKKVLFHARDMWKHSRLAKLLRHPSKPWPLALAATKSGITKEQMRRSWLASAFLVTPKNIYIWSNDCKCSPACLLPLFQLLRCC